MRRCSGELVTQQGASLIEPPQPELAAKIGGFRAVLPDGTSCPSKAGVVSGSPILWIHLQLRPRALLNAECGFSRGDHSVASIERCKCSTIAIHIDSQLVQEPSKTASLVVKA